MARGKQTCKILKEVVWLWLGMLAFTCHAAPNPQTTDDNLTIAEEMVYPDSVVDVKPDFPGGDKAFLQFFAENFKFPPTTANFGGGKIIVKYIVDKNGKVCKFEIIKNTLPMDLSPEIIRVFNILPEFKPGEIKGESVNVWQTIPISIR